MRTYSTYRKGRVPNKVSAALVISSSAVSNGTLEESISKKSSEILNNAWAEGGYTYSSTVVEFWPSRLNGQGGDTLVDWTSGSEEGEGEESGERELHGYVFLVGCLGWW